MQGEIQAVPYAKAEALYRKVICGDRPVPLPGSQPGQRADTWECYSCGRENAGSEQRCECGYRSLAAEASGTGGEVGQLRAELYWECICQFSLNTRNVERCLKCGVVNLEVAEEVQRNKKPLPPLLQRSRFRDCSLS